MNKSLSQSLAEIASAVVASDANDVPEDFAANFRHYLYTYDKGE